MNKKILTGALALAACLPMFASAHKAFLVPSSTVLSDTSAWITVDAAVSNDLFYFNHRPLNLEQLVVTAPDGATLSPQNVGKGELRSTFDLHLEKPGTYRIALGGAGLFANYVDAKGEKKRWRGPAEKLGDIPADAKDVEITQSESSNVSFVTLGKPSDAVLKPTGKGLEFAPLTHPNDLYEGEPAKFRFLLDGKPAKDLKVTVIPAGTRYRSKQDEQSFTTDANGEFSVTWPAAGMYWMNTSLDGQKPTMPKAKERRLGFTATFEVLPQ